jgi:hypothetical protein
MGKKSEQRAEISGSWVLAADDREEEGIEPPATGKRAAIR